MLNQENVSTRLNRLERQTTQLRLCVFLLLGYVLLSSGVSDTIAALVSAKPRSSLTGQQESKETREQAKPAISSPPASKPALTKQANVSDLVQTRRLQLINNEGTVVLDFFAGGDTGNGVINVKNANGTRLIQLAASGGGLVSLFNGSGERTLALNAGGQGKSGLLSIKQPDGNDLMYFGSSTKGNALVDLGGNSRRGVLYIDNDTDQTVVSLSTSSEFKGGRIDLKAGDGKNLVSAGPTGDGNGGLWLRNTEGETAVSLAAVNKSGVISIRHSNGPDVFYAGGDSNDDGMIKTRNSAGQLLFNVGTNRFAEPAAVLELYSLSTNERLVYLGESAQNNGILELSASDGREMLRAGAARNQGAISSYNSDNKMIFLLDGPNGNGRVRTFTSSGQTAFSSDNVTVSGSSTSGLTADIDGDGDVDGDDFLLLSHHFGRSSTKKTAKTEADGK